MDKMEEVFELFAASFNKRAKCSECNKKCSQFCPDQCLDYTSNQIPNYNCDYLRDAYVLRYFPTHKAELKNLYNSNTRQIIKHMSLEKRKDKLAILGLGAGPGTDLIAFCEWLEQHSSQIQELLSVTFIRSDSNDNWRVQYNKLRQIYKATIDAVSNDFVYKKRIADAFDSKGWPKNTHITSASYLFSELKSENDFSVCKRRISDFWDSFKDKTDKQSIILINDRPEVDIRNLSTYLANLISTDYSNSVYKEYCFKSDLFRDMNGISVHANKWCGCHIPDDMQKRFKSKTSCTSYQCIIFVNKN